MGHKCKAATNGRFLGSENIFTNFIFFHFSGVRTRTYARAKVYVIFKVCGKLRNLPFRHHSGACRNKDAARVQFLLQFVDYFGELEQAIVRVERLSVQPTCRCDRVNLPSMMRRKASLQRGPVCWPIWLLRKRAACFDEYSFEFLPFRVIHVP